MARSKGYSDFDWIISGKLAQGAYPDPPDRVFATFDTVVFTAEEAQPRWLSPPAGKTPIFVPMDDDLYRPVDLASAQILNRLANQLADEVVRGRKVLITCWQGANRSGLLTALVLMKVKGMNGAAAIRTIQQRRRPKGIEALCNPMFQQFLLSLPG